MGSGLSKFESPVSYPNLVGEFASAGHYQQPAARSQPADFPAQPGQTLTFA
jgi:hypothetical protein